MKLLFNTVRVCTFLAGLYFIYLGLGTLGVLPSSLDLNGWFSQHQPHWTGGFIGLGGVICLVAATFINRF